MTTAGKSTRIFLSASGSFVLADEVDGFKEATISNGAAMLDASVLGTAYKLRVAGPTDGAVELSGDRAHGDAPQALGLTKLLSGDALHVGVSWDGSSGHKVQCVVESVSFSVDSGSLVSANATLQHNGAVASFTTPVV